MRELWSKLFRSRRDLDSDLADEMQAHYELMVEENIARGMTRDEARSAARRHFGNRTLTHELAREAWRFPTLESLFLDVRHGLRGMRRAPGFAFFVIATLALGIGVNTAIFSVIYSVLLRPLPFPMAERLVRIAEDAPRASGISVTWINYQHLRNESRSFEEMAGFQTARFTLTGRGEAAMTTAGVVTREFFGLIGARPLQGRTFTEDEDRPGAAPVAVLTHEFWSSKLGSDPAILSSALALNGKAYRVVGVLAPGPGFFASADFYVPLGPQAAKATTRGQHSSMRVLGRLKEGVTLAAANRDLNLVMERLATSDPGEESEHRMGAQLLATSRTADVSVSLWMLMGAAGLVLLLGCANVASLLLVRGTARVREMAIRTAIGAGRARLGRQLITENLTLSLIGGALGVLLAHACLRAMIAAAPDGIPRFSEARLDLHVLMFATVVTLAVGLLVGLAPALAANRVDLSVALKDGAPSAGAGRRGSTVRGALVVSEIAVTVMLLFASSLLLRSLISARDSHPGFDSSRLLALEIQLPSSRYPEGRDARRYFEDLMTRLRGEPGVEEVTAVNCPPSAGSCGDWWYSIVEKPAPARDSVPLSLFNTVEPGYFRTMRIRLLAGREFAASDREGGPRVAIVNETLTRRWWKSPREAVGSRIKVGGPYADGSVFEIVGVAGSVAQMGLDTDPMDEIYFSNSQRGSHSMAVMIRTAADPLPLIPSIRLQVAATDNGIPVRAIGRVEDKLGATLATRRFGTLLLAAFAALAMVLAFVGVYGVLDYWVGVRKKEIAVRLALGARPLAIVRWVGAHAARLAGVGIVLGAAGGWAASGLLKSLVFGVSEQDPATMAAAAAGVLGIALLAAGVPMWRAVRLDPVRNLQQ